MFHHITVSGGPSLRFRVLLYITLFVVITPNSWHGRVLLSATSPPKPPFPQISSTKGLIVRDCHDKRLRFSVFSCDCFSLDLLLFCFSQLFWSKWPFFVFRRKINLTIEIVKIKNFRIRRSSFQALFCC